LPTPGKVEDEEKPSFSDEEEVVEEEAHAVEAPKAKKKSDGKVKAKKKNAKQLAAEKAAQLEAEKVAAEKMKAMTSEERMAEKLRLQKLVEEADNQLTDELFAKQEDGVFDEDVVAATLQTIPLDTEEHFRNFASAIGKRLELEDKQLRTREFVKELLRSVAPTLPYEDLQEIDSVLSVVKNTKVKKTLNKKKKKQTKTFAKVQRDMFDYEDGGNYAAGGDDYDFM